MRVDNNNNIKQYIYSNNNNNIKEYLSIYQTFYYYH